ncbi:YggS family pyridoxal phosphate-dependent enzyme [Oscillatoriales cyanobacterium LEGE 11467]|uniref:Pyridoxal phosphate homeostasis protein n=1 Tax=Zarconia navalis LEGE 11467 TaxID=1828826 RepID=A0A928Z627_9CYAN|nr:YggS family pyridoxal phosphate-dependent enzyme [Zarconia navalis]MBE9039922.1 YggS family pyridoxal phosphate-dependent enzyme [Zarconia navalis LEGE 11467]
MDSDLAQRIAKITSTLSPSVRSIAVSKTVSPERIRDAYAAGVRDFGENRIQEATAKQDQLQDLNDITWHFIGHLQSNKAKIALERFDWIHSVDRLKLAQTLNRFIEKGCPSPILCLQVKLRPDPNKSGWTVSELLADLPALEQCKALNIQGLMTIAPLGLDESETRAVFRETRQLADRIRALNLPGISITELSMGMSGDYPLAVAEGATAVRLGRSVFGER